MNDLLSLYHDLILDHCRHPQHFGPLNNPTHTAEGYNPICGDEVKIYLEITDDRIHQLQFTGTGCAICLASASMMAVLLQNKTVNETQNLIALFHSLLTTENPLPETELLGKLTILANVKKYPIRVKCATLAWHTLKAALEHNHSPISTEKEDD